MRDRTLLTVLAASFLAGEQIFEQVVLRGGRTLGRPWRWLRPVARRYLVAFASGTRPRHRDVVQFLRADASVVFALRRYASELHVSEWLTEPQNMAAVPAARGWKLPVIESAGALADWLWLEPEELNWFADLKGLTATPKDARLSHYRYRILHKRSGGIRLIEAPKPRLKSLQRQILEYILDCIPAHPAAHGFVKARSTRTFAAPHTGAKAVLRIDLQDYFPTFTGARVQALFRTAGYPEAVADLLGGICTNAAPRSLFPNASEPRDLYQRPHLPQGAPSSPALANICTYRVDCRLTGLAQASGAIYTRYADDLAFSGGDNFARSARRFSVHAAAILMEEGFSVNHHKTRIMRQGVRQHLAGLVVNQHLNVKRAEFDMLKATLTNCIRLGPESQNRGAHPAFRAHLEGRVSFVESINPEKAKRLRALFQQIRWQ